MKGKTQQKSDGFKQQSAFNSSCVSETAFKETFLRLVLAAVKLFIRPSLTLSADIFKLAIT